MFCIVQYFNIFIAGLVEPAKQLYEQWVADNNYYPKRKKKIHDCIKPVQMKIQHFTLLSFLRATYTHLIELQRFGGVINCQWIIECFGTRNEILTL